MDKPQALSLKLKIIIFILICTLPTCMLSSNCHDTSTYAFIDLNPAELDTEYPHKLDQEELQAQVEALTPTFPLEGLSEQNLEQLNKDQITDFLITHGFSINNNSDL